MAISRTGKYSHSIPHAAEYSNVYSHTPTPTMRITTKTNARGIEHNSS
jgi:hypothetical protein